MIFPSSLVIYLVTCGTCNILYEGQTTQELRQRHYGHRSDIRSGTAGLGSHFKEYHGNGLDLKDKYKISTCMNSFSLVVAARLKKFIFKIIYFQMDRPKAIILT